MKGAFQQLFKGQSKYNGIDGPLGGLKRGGEENEGIQMDSPRYIYYYHRLGNECDPYTELFNAIRQSPEVGSYWSSVNYPRAVKQDSKLRKLLKLEKIPCVTVWPMGNRYYEDDAYNYMKQYYNKTVLKNSGNKRGKFAHKYKQLDESEMLAESFGVNPEYKQSVPALSGNMKRTDVFQAESGCGNGSGTPPLDFRPPQMPNLGPKLGAQQFQEIAQKVKSNLPNFSQTVSNTVQQVKTERISQIEEQIEATEQMPPPPSVSKEMMMINGKKKLGSKFSNRGQAEKGDGERMLADIAAQSEEKARQLGYHSSDRHKSS